MTWVAVAVAGGAIVGGVISSQGAKDAAQTGADATNAATVQNKAIWQQTQANLQPYMQSGTMALGQLQSALGMGPGGQDPAVMQRILQSDPGYQFRMQQGQQSILDTQSARGGVNSGMTLKALSDYGQGTGSQEFQNYIQQLGGLATSGQNAAAGLGGIGANFGNSQANLLTGGANFQGAAQISGANAMAGGVNGLSNAFQQYLMQQQQNQGSYGNWAGTGGMNGLGTYGPVGGTAYDPAYG